MVAGRAVGLGVGSGCQVQNSVGGRDRLIPAQAGREETGESKAPGDGLEN